MVINQDQYNELVQKLAEEIVSDAGIEVEASEDNMEVQAGLNPVNYVKGAVKGVKDNLHSAKVLKEVGDDAGKKYYTNQAIKSGAPLAGGTVATGAGAAGVIETMKRKKQEKAASDQLEGMDKEAQEAYVNSVIDKAASTFQESQIQKQAALAMLEEAEAKEAASMQVMDELGLLEE